MSILTHIKEKGPPKRALFLKNALLCSNFWPKLAKLGKNHFP